MKDTKSLRAVFVIEGPYCLVIQGHKRFEAIIERQRAMANFFNNRLKQDYRGSKDRRFKKVHLGFTFKVRAAVNIHDILPHLRQENIGVWNYEMAVGKETVLSTRLWQKAAGWCA
jgi:hypothetical protein